jgi:hypothetical protein
MRASSVALPIAAARIVAPPTSVWGGGRSARTKNAYNGTSTISDRANTVIDAAGTVLDAPLCSYVPATMNKPP